MRKIKQPKVDVAAVLECCAESIRDRVHGNKLRSALDAIVAAENAYREAGERSSLYLIPESKNVAGILDCTQMSDFYSTTFVKNPKPREIYDALMALAPSGICPLCNHQCVSTLDHYLAKSCHSALTITPLNLVPSCRDCNLGSNARRPKNAKEQTLHPYFDFVDDEIWLKASVIQAERGSLGAPVVRFLASPPKEWLETKQERVITHFETFRLGKLYTTQAAAELVEIHSNLLNFENPIDVKDYLMEQAASRRNAFKNSWKAAMYQGLAESEWFCSGGYKDIRHADLLQHDTICNLL